MRHFPSLSNSLRPVPSGGPIPVRNSHKMGQDFGGLGKRHVPSTEFGEHPSVQAFSIESKGLPERYGLEIQIGRQNNLSDTNKYDARSELVAESVVRSPVHAQGNWPGFANRTDQKIRAGHQTRNTKIAEYIHRNRCSMPLDSASWNQLPDCSR